MTELDKIVSKSTITEDEFLKCISKGVITRDLLGKEVIIKNSLSTPAISPTAYNENYVIADINHDYVYGAVDLVAKNVINRGDPIGLASSYDNLTSTSAYYVESYIDKWLNDVFLQGFSENIRNALVDMKVESNGSVVDRKIKLLSVTEVGGNASESLSEGHPYPIFADDNSRIKYKSYSYSSDPTVNYTYSTPTFYWLRSRALDVNGDVFMVGEDGKPLYSCLYTNCMGIVPVLRFMQEPNDLLSKRYLTEDELLRHLDTGFTRDFIGKEVYISNNTYTELFEIADIDHDDECGSIDLINKEYVYVGGALYGKDGVRLPYGEPVEYKDSNIRKFLNDQYYNGFSDSLRENMLPMTVGDNNLSFKQYKDYVRALSCRELGLVGTEINERLKVARVVEEGDPYPIFDPEDINTLLRGDKGGYLLRSIEDVESDKKEFDFGVGYYHETVKEPSIFLARYSSPYNLVSTIRLRNNSRCDDMLSGTDWLTENEFLYCLKKNAFTEENIGKLVHLPNPYASESVYRIADIEHDGVKGAVDLIPLSPVNNYKSFEEDHEQNNNYAQSSIRTYINVEIYGGFSSKVKAATATFPIKNTTGFDENGKPIEVIEYDHIKLLTCTEVGFSDYSYLDDGGSKYPIFNENKDRIKYVYYRNINMPREWWLMSAYDQTTYDVMGVSEFGGFGAYNIDSPLGVVPVLRFIQGEQEPEPETPSTGEDDNTDEEETE